MSADPLHQFVVKPIVDINIAGVDVSFTNSALFMVLSAVVSVFVLLLAFRGKHFVPTRFQAFGELLFEFIDGMIKDNVGPEGRKYFPFVFSVFIFILMGNMLGMIPYTFTFTGQIVVTFSLALLVFLTVTMIAIMRHGFHFFSFFFPQGAPVALAPILIPIEILSYLSRPVSLAVRLFANMMAGHTMLKVFAGFTVALGVFGFAPLAINVALTAFEILVAFLQAYVFTILTCLYLNDAIHLH